MWRVWKFITVCVMSVWLIINPPCDECGYNGCNACTDEE